MVKGERIKMKNKYNIGDKCFVIEKDDKEFKILEAEITKVDSKCNSKNGYEYGLKILTNNNNGCNWTSYSELKLFDSEKDAEIFLTEILNNAKFRVNDLVVRKEDKYFYSIYRINIDYIDKDLKYDLMNLFEKDTWHSTYSNVSESNLVKINKEHIPFIVEYKTLYKEIQKLEEERDNKIEELSGLISNINNEFKLNLRSFYSHRDKFFNTETYKKSRLLFGNDEN